MPSKEKPSFPCWCGKTYKNLLAVCQPLSIGGHRVLNQCLYLSREALHLLDIASETVRTPEEVAALAAIFYRSKDQRKIAQWALAGFRPEAELDKCTLCYADLKSSESCISRTLCKACGDSLQSILRKWIASQQARIEELRCILQ